VRFVCHILCFFLHGNEKSFELNEVSHTDFTRVVHVFDCRLILFQSPTLFTLLVIPEGINITHDGMQSSKLTSGSLPSVPPKPAIGE
jgi:hypothetical protein